METSNLKIEVSEQSIKADMIMRRKVSKERT